MKNKENRINRLTIHIDFNNEAFQNGNYEDEMCRILEELMERVGTDEDGIIKDVNGNRTGLWITT